MMSDMYNRMTAACHRKCVPPKYREADLSKGESVCLDIHERIGKKLTQMSKQDEEFVKKLQEQQQQAAAVANKYDFLMQKFVIQNLCFVE